MGDFSRREVAMMVVGLLVFVALTVWTTFRIMPYLFPRDASDPLVKSDGLKTEQTIQTK
jgi:hypothetical protein